MKIIKKALTLDRLDYFEKHLLIINHLLPEQMTPMQAKVLAAFMSFTGDLAKDPFSTLGRKLVREKLTLSPGGLGNYLKQLNDKGFLLTEGEGYKILPILIPESKEQFYQFKLSIKNE